jgi:hypothetical protein
VPEGGRLKIKDVFRAAIITLHLFTMAVNPDNTFPPRGAIEERVTGLAEFKISPIKGGQVGGTFLKLELTEA